jgi:heme/copper-type cytochrome/quinol oxidase subunit 2
MAAATTTTRVVVMVIVIVLVVLMMGTMAIYIILQLQETKLNQTPLGFKHNTTYESIYHTNPRMYGVVTK